MDMNVFLWTRRWNSYFRRVHWLNLVDRSLKVTVQWMSLAAGMSTTENMEIQVLEQA